MSISLDSCKIRIPMHQVEVLNDSLLSHWIPMEMNTETGELRETGSDFRTKAYYHSDKGISTRVAIERQVTADKSVKDYLTIGINAKMLQGRYFEGITRQNLHMVHEYLMGLKLASFSLEALREAQVTDADYKKDFRCGDMDALTLRLEVLTIPKRKKGEGCKRYREMHNKGIEWSDRKSTAIATAPFLKVYSKELDLKHNSTEFHENYTQGQDIAEVARVEFTIKNRKHFRKYEVEDTTLYHVIDLPQEKLEDMLQTSIRKHIEQPVRPRTDDQGINPREQEMVNLISLLIANRVGINEAKSILFRDLKRDTQIRRRRLFDEVWQKHFSNFERAEQVNQVEGWLEQVGVRFL